jgi:hypothetical protein
LAGLAALQRLVISDNLLSGQLPASLTALALSRFWYDLTDLCEPGDATFQSWLGGIAELQRTAMICGTGSVSGIVWEDPNLNGIRDAGEPPLPGITVRLSINAGVQSLVATGRQVLTDSSGSYRFDFVADGALLVDATAPPGYKLTVPMPVAISVTGGGDVTAAPIGLAAITYSYLPFVRR